VDRLNKAAKVVALHRVTAGHPVPDKFCKELEALLEDARDGKITSVAYAAIGPDFARLNNAYIAGRSDRMNILGQLAVMTAQLFEMEKGDDD
jgi:hypothetical protein